MGLDPRLPGRRSRSGRRPRARSASSATSTPGTAACTRCARSASSGIWELFLPGVEPGARYKYEILTADGELPLKADPYAQETELPPKTASVVYAVPPPMEPADADWLAQPPRAPAAGRADVDLRGPPRLVAAEHARGQPLADLPRARRRAVRVRQGHGLHARRAAAGDGTTRSAAPGATRSPATSRPRRATARPTTCASSSTACTPSGIGVILDWVPAHFPRDDVRARAVRRHRAVRARRPAPRRASRLGHAGVQLRPPRGPQLPDLQRAVLAARVPRRRHPRRRRRLDAVPRLLAPRGRVGAQPSSAAARTSTRSRSSRSSTR